MRPESFDPYAALGLPVGATTGEIRRRYRQLARKLHPDVRRAESGAHEQFIQVRRAYEMLMDDDMRRRLEEQLMAAADEIVSVVDDFEGTFARAEDLSRNGHYAQAKGLCADLLRARPMEPRTFELLARIYDIEGSELLQEKMAQEAERLRGLREAARAEAVRPREPRPRVRVPRYREIWQAEPIRKRPGVLLLGLAAIAGCVAAVGLASAEPLLAGFSLAEIAAGAGAGFLGAFCAVAGGLLGSFDEELGVLVAEASGVRSPLWLYLMTAGLVSVGLALIFYLVFALLEHGLSRDVLAFFAGTLALTAMMALAHAGVWWPVLLYGANLLFLTGLLGWAFGSMLRPGQWWQR